MKSKISIQNVAVTKQCIDVTYTYTSGLQSYFHIENNVFRTEYSIPLQGLPESVAVIPFIVNILPIIWLTDAILEVPRLDRSFYQSIEKFKQGYISMYPQMKFTGEIHVAKVETNVNRNKGNQTVGTFFSGGVDAFATLFAHIHERPLLITLQGSDIGLEDEDGWKNVSGHVTQTADMFDLECVFVKTNFRSFINERKLNCLVKNSGDGWWHGFQHGIGLLGHGAPIAYLKGLKCIYIASSYTPKDNVTCASHPSIDNCVEFCNCHIIHDQYEYSRQEKIEHICQYIQSTKYEITLRVCWDSRGGRNCCACEKCYRTIAGLLAEGVDPEKYGFKGISTKYERIKDDILKRFIFMDMHIPYWKDIQRRCVENRRNIHLPQEMDWIYDYNFDHVNMTFSKQLKINYQKTRSLLSKIKHTVIK